MRALLVGIIFLLTLPAVVIAQVSGSVESIGFESYFRPDCWTPMVVTVTPETAKTDFYQIHVKLQDLDRDLPTFQRTISVTGASEGQTRQQKFRMYFVPPPTDDGLPDARDPGALKDLPDRLKVSLHNSAGKWICDLPITGTLNNVDPKPQTWTTLRGAKLVVCVSEGRSRPIYHDSAVAPLLGVLEDAIFVTVRPGDLPENVLGYDAVDAIVWLDADPAQLKAGGDDKFRALESYVRRGGRLVIGQPADWQKTLGFERLLPVTIHGIEEKDDLMPLREMATPPSQAGEAQLAGDPFAGVKPPFRFARATAAEDAVVTEWITWKTADDRSPYVVHRPLAMGSVTWVAQDLGDPALVRSRRGWVYVWNRIFGWNNTPLVANSQLPEDAKRLYDTGPAMEMGHSLLSRWMDLQSKSAWLITLALLFFIGYWLISGPATYGYLAAKGRTHLSWFIFAACALAATALTVLIVKLVLRGPPELKHFSVVKIALNQPAVVTSRIGLYIPRDGLQRIELTDAAADSVSSITALPIHPVLLGTVPDQPGAEYTVPIVDAAAGQNAVVEVPYRSTLKKFQATWIGEVEGAIHGSPRLATSGWIDGRLTNGTGKRLVNVYIAFNYPIEGTLGGDWILFLPAWENGITLDLAAQFNADEEGARMPVTFAAVRPTGRRRVSAKLSTEWEPYWLGNMPPGLKNEYDDSTSTFRQSLVMLSLFDRLEPAKNTPNSKLQRIELLRRGGRGLDVSQCLTAGQLVVLAEATGPLPMPLKVEGKPATGDGLILYQFVLPLDRSALTQTPTE